MTTKIPSLTNYKEFEPMDLILQQSVCALYLKIYNFLKAQRTILENILETINEINPSTHEAKRVFIDKLNEILNAEYGSLFIITQKSVREIEETLKKELPKELNILGYRIIKCISALTRVRSLLSIALPSEMKPPTKHPNFSSEKRDNCCMCRICEEYIPIDQLEQHILVCARVNESMKMVQSVDENARRLLFRARKTVLNHPWPYNSVEAHKCILPILHCCILLEKLLEIDTESGDSLSKMRDIYDAIECIEIEMQHHEDAKMILRNSIKCAKEKLKACKSIDTLIQKGGCHPANVHLYDFKFIKPISSGAYAGVFLARKERTGDIYAIKVIDRNRAQQKKTAFIERNILRNFTSDHIVKLFYTLTGKYFLYIVMEFVQGGDLKKVLENVGCVDEEYARTYLVQIVSALADLRNVGVVHRDLKPDNVLIDSNGHLKLADFGLSVSGIVERSMDFVGTPDYVAPEIVLNKGHTFTADYWSLGVLAYELLTGVPPFHGSTPEETFMNICEGHFWPIDASDEAKDLINSLLKPDPSERLGSKGVEEIMEHPFFDGIDWNDIESLEPPFVPYITTDQDTSYFSGIDATRMSEFRMIEYDIALSRARSQSFGPEQFEELKNMQGLSAFDLDNFSGVSTKTLVASTLQHALGKQGRRLSLSIVETISNSQFKSPLISTIEPTPRRRRSHQSRTPAPFIMNEEEDAKKKEKIMLRVSKEDPF